jgi:hypothetical protein
MWVQALRESAATCASLMYWPLTKTWRDCAVAPLENTDVKTASDIATQARRTAAA